MPFVADTDPRFVTLHPDLRAVLRETERLLEASMREAMEAAFAQLAGGAVRDLVMPNYETFAARLPATFIRGQYQIYKMLDDQRKLSEYLIRQKRGSAPTGRTH